MGSQQLCANNPEVWKFVDLKNAVKDALSIKSLDGKIGYAGIAIDTAMDVKGDYKTGGISRVAAGITVNATLGVASLASGAAIGAAAGSIVPGLGTIVGAAAGVVIASGIAIATNTEINGKSVNELMKDGVQHIGNILSNNHFYWLYSTDHFYG